MEPGNSRSDKPPREAGGVRDGVVTPTSADDTVSLASTTGGETANPVSAGLAGYHLGRYRMVRRIGAGGMGEVWLADDPTLGRKAAIKLLPFQFTANSQRVRRFEREARSASALNHPNIITIYETGSDKSPFGTFHFLATEYIEGATLRQRLKAGKIEINEALDIVVQSAAALNAAHLAGLIHRDIKPENIMIRPDGLVKVLDFGLAKLVEDEDDPVEGDAAEEKTSLTVAGSVMGTPQYMSPEQVEARKVDARTDIFSLAVVLYELLSGKKLFGGPSFTSVFEAIVTQEPEPISRVVPEAPPELDAILGKALTKDREERYQTIREFSADLERVRAARRQPAIVSAWWRSPYTALAVAALAVCGWGAYRWLAPGSSRPSGSPPVTVPFTSFLGSKDYASFSPDGTRIVFSWDGAKDERIGKRNIYTKAIGDGAPLQLTSAPEDDLLPAWSPDGQSIAFLRLLDGVYSVVVMPAAGGREREIGKASSGVSWSPDGAELAISSVITKEDRGSVFAVTPATGKQRRLTAPAAPFRDRQPTFSPDGKLIAFMRSESPSSRDLYVVPAGGGPERRLTFDHRPIFGLAWTAGSRELVFAVNRGGGRGLWRVPVTGGDPERILVTGNNPSSTSISRQGDKLVYTDTYSDSNLYLYEGEGFNGRPVPGKFGKPVRFASSTREDTSAQFSPDGERIVFSSQRTGGEEIWICRRDGSQLMQLTTSDGPASGTPRWSPDGRFISYDSRAAGSPDVYVVSSQGGKPRRLTGMPYDDSVPSWSRDGMWIYFTSDRSGRLEIWKMPMEGGEPIQITRTGALEGMESPDGKLVYFNKNRGVYGIWSAPVNGGEEKLVPGLEKAGFWRSWGVLQEGIYFITKEANSPPPVRFYSFATRRVTPLLSVEKEALWWEPGLTISSDGRHLIYSQLDHAVNDILLMENFR